MTTCYPKLHLEVFDFQSCLLVEHFLFIGIGLLGVGSKWQLDGFALKLLRCNQSNNLSPLLQYLTVLLSLHFFLRKVIF